MHLNGIYYDPQSFYCQKFRTSRYIVMFTISQVKFFPIRIRYHNLKEIAPAFSYNGNTMVQFMTRFESYFIKIFP